MAFLKHRDYVRMNSGMGDNLPVASTPGPLCTLHGLIRARIREPGFWMQSVVMGSAITLAWGMGKGPKA